MKDKIKQLANDYAAVLKETKSMGCNEIRALYNIPPENIELIVQALKTIKKLSDRKMTTEVLENYMQFEDECVKRGFTFKSMIEARKKQITRKPDFTEDKEFALCPCCNGKGLFDKQKYCDNCGQKIDWSEESEG